MKILVQDLETCRFLSVNGSWVAEKDAARDFHSLLPAYQYARDFTSRRFQVLLYCPDDRFCVSMIAGEGIARPQTRSIAGRRPEKKKRSARVRTGLGRFNGVVLPLAFDDAPWHLN
jgi:hypothetical protein